MRRLVWLLVAAVSLCAGPACIKAPDVVIVDKKTALEEQSAGSFKGLEEELEQAGQAPRPTPLTGAQLVEAGIAPPTATVEVDDAAGLPDALRADALLIQRCIGEGKDGLLALTADRCTGTIDVPQVTRLIERVNRNRRQLWQWLAGREPKRPLDEVRTKWREVHLSGAVCGAAVQKDDGSWEVKRC